MFRRAWPGQLDLGEFGDGVGEGVDDEDRGAGEVEGKDVTHHESQYLVEEVEKRILAQGLFDTDERGALFLLQQN